MPRIETPLSADAELGIGVSRSTCVGWTDCGRARAGTLCGGGGSLARARTLGRTGLAGLDRERAALGGTELADLDRERAEEGGLNSGRVLDATAALGTEGAVGITDVLDSSAANEALPVMASSSSNEVLSVAPASRLSMDTVGSESGKCGSLSFSADGKSLGAAGRNDGGLREGACERPLTLVADAVEGAVREICGGGLRGASGAWGDREGGPAGIESSKGNDGRA